jgi:PAS domain S-box-containing protein
VTTPELDRAADERTLPIAEVLRSEARLRALVESDSLMVWTTDPWGMVEDMPVWRRLTGQSLDEVRGAGWMDAIHPHDREATARAWNEANATPQPYRAEYRLRMADGSYRWFQARGVPVLAGDGSVREWAGTFHDVHARRLAEAERAALLAGVENARRRAEEHAAESAEMASRLQEQAAEMQEQVAGAQALAQALEAANERLVNAHHAVEAALEDEARLVETLHRIGVSLTAERDLPRIVQAATDEATALTGAQFGAFFYNVLNDAGESYTLYTISGVPREAFSRFPMPRNTEVFATTFRGEGVLRSGDITQDPRYGRNAPHHGMPAGHLPVRSYLAVPVTAQGGEVLGGLFFGHAEPDVFGERGERVAVGIAGWAAVAIENARLHDAERRARAAAERAAERAERLLEVAQDMARALTAEEVAGVALEQGMAAVGADAGSMALLSEDGTEFRIVDTRGYPQPVAERFRRFPLHPGRPYSDAVLTGQPLLLPSLDAWRARYPQTVDTIRETGYAGYAAAPIVVDGRAIGALGFSFGAEQGFDDGVGVFLETLAGQCGAALERARLYQAEHAARAEAEAANRAKGQFLASMSHELRTPLNAIGGYVDLIQMELRGPVTEQQQSDLERVKRAQQHLLGLINDVLNFAKLEAGRIELQIGDVALDGLLDDVEGLIAPQAAARGIAFAPAPGDVPVYVRADREKLEQVLLNLLSNAVKFTPPGGRVSLDWVQEEGEVRVRVHDTGCGVPPDKQASIFEPFVQVDPDLTRTRQGTGLGLAISRELARAMGGDVTVRSALGEGSTFTVHLRPAEGGS